MQGSMELSAPKDVRVPPLSSPWVLPHLMVAHMKNNRAKAHILYLQVNMALLWGMRTDDHGQPGRGAERLGSGQVCVGMRLASLTHEPHIGPWALYLCIRSLPCLPTNSPLGGAALPSLSN